MDVMTGTKQAVFFGEMLYANVPYRYALLEIPGHKVLPI